MTLESPFKNQETVGSFLSISQLNAMAAGLLADSFGLVWIEGEISTLTLASSGHLYFSLKDQTASVRAVMFKGRLADCELQPQPGDHVHVQARVGVYEPRGDFQLNVQVLRPAGRGTLHAQFERLKARLQSEGLFDSAVKRPIPLHPSAIGVVTSLGAAALHDVLTALARRAPHVPVVVYPASVQGQAAPHELRRALARANERAEVDVVLLVRGGGSLEDLWAFNDEGLARDIAASQLPVIAGVGHESDVTIADFVADLRAPTPTAAAELACEPRAVLLDNLQRQGIVLAERMRRRLERLTQRLDQAGLRLVSPQQRLQRQAQHLTLLVERLHHRKPDLAQRTQQVQRSLVSLHSLLASRQAGWQARLSVLAARLQALSPDATLARGFAIVRDQRGRLLTDASNANPGDRLAIQLAQGALTAQVTAPVMAPPATAKPSR